MNKIETIKAAISPADAAERYGLKVGRNGMALCPFHDDHHPSMKLYEDHFHCFACAAHGDVLDLAAKLLNVSISGAIRQLEADFGIRPNEPLTAVRPAKPYSSRSRENALLCLDVLTEYERLLRRWKSEFMPKTPADPVDDRYVEACQMLERIEHLTDFFWTAGREERDKMADKLIKDGLIQKLRRRLEEVKKDGRAA